jgi:hypothetical protein
MGPAEPKTISFWNAVSSRRQVLSLSDWQPPPEMRGAHGHIPFYLRPPALGPHHSHRRAACSSCYRTCPPSAEHSGYAASGSSTSPIPRRRLLFSHEPPGSVRPSPPVARTRRALLLIRCSPKAILSTGGSFSNSTLLSFPDCGGGSVTCPFGGQPQGYSPGLQYAFASSEAPTLAQGGTDCLGDTTSDAVGGTYDDV